MTHSSPVRKRLFFFGILAAAMTAAAWTYGLFLENNTLFHSIFIPASFLGLGMLIKFGDQAFDEDAYSKRTTVLLAIPGGLWMGSLIAVDAGSATIFAGVLVALLFAGKLDNLAFKIGFAVALVLGVASFLLGTGTLSVVGALVVLAAAYVDERTNDLPGVDGGHSWKAVLLHHRPFLKVAVLALCLIGLLPSFLYLFAFLAFDFGYSLVEAMSLTKEAVAVG